MMCDKLGRLAVDWLSLPDLGAEARRGPNPSHSLRFSPSPPFPLFIPSPSLPLPTLFQPSLPFPVFPRTISRFWLTLINRGQNREGWSSCIRRQSQNTQASGPEIEKLKGCLGGGLCYPKATVCTFVMYKLGTFTCSKIARTEGGKY